jgi:drug/metabolite transporter (DMT)-like permease
MRRGASRKEFAVFRSEDDRGAGGVPLAVPIAQSAASPGRVPAAARPSSALTVPSPTVAPTGAATSGLVGRFHALSADLRGSIIQVVSFLFFTLLAVCVKLIGSRVPVVEILFFRQVLILVFMLPFHMGDLGGLVRTRRPGFQVARGLVAATSMVLGFTALIHLPLADANAIGFAEVLFMTAGAALVLKEKVDWRRWAATGVGLAGVTVMLSPAGAGLSIWTLTALAAPLFGAATTIMVRLMAERESTSTILFWQSAVIIAALAVPTAWFWVTPTVDEMALLLVIGLCGLAGQWLYTRAYQIGEAAALAPMHFSRLLMAAVMGFLLFGEMPTVATVLGAALVIGATIYTLNRNATRVPA